MSPAGPESIQLSWADQWADVWRRNNPRNYVYDVYFDRETRELVWIDNPNTTLTPIDNDPFDRKTEIVTSDPDRYEPIAPLDHAEHSEIFRQWVNGWPAEVRDKCEARSLESFVDDLRQISPERADAARAEWNAYHEDCLKALAMSWLRRRGIAVEWGE